MSGRCKARAKVEGITFYVFLSREGEPFLDLSCWRPLDGHVAEGPGTQRPCRPSSDDDHLLGPPFHREREMDLGKREAFRLWVGLCQTLWHSGDDNPL